MIKIRALSLLFCPFLFLFFSSTVAAQSEDVRLNGAYLKSYLTNSGKIVTAPFHWKKKDWTNVYFTALGGTMLYLVDKDIQVVAQSNRTHVGNEISKYFAERNGSGIYTLPLMAGMYIYGAISHHTKFTSCGLLGIEAYLLAGATVSFPKYIFQRHRPYQDNPAYPYHWNGPLNGYSHYTSFPSGHTASAFSIATVVATEFSETKWVSVLSYSIATLTGLSRINDNKHWASDVLVGAAFGYAIGKLVSRQTLLNPVGSSIRQQEKIEAFLKQENFVN